MKSGFKKFFVILTWLIMIMLTIMSASAYIAGSQCVCGTEWYFYDNYGDITPVKGCSCTNPSCGTAYDCEVSCGNNLACFDNPPYCYIPSYIMWPQHNAHKQLCYTFTAPKAGNMICDIQIVTSCFGFHTGLYQYEEKIEVVVNGNHVGYTDDPYCNTFAYECFVDGPYTTYFNDVILSVKSGMNSLTLKSMEDSVSLQNFKMSCEYVGCQTDSDCDYLDKTYCSQDYVKHDEGKCINSECTKETTILENCNIYNTNYCQGTQIIYRDYTCSNALCVLDSIDSTECNDSLYCNGQETCKNAECVAGTAIDCSDNLYCTVNEHCDETTDSCVHDNRDCSQNNIPGISTCNNNPDNNPFTFDYRADFTSVCNENQDKCTTSSYTITHSCSINQCEAQCEDDDDCDNGYCNDDCECVTQGPICGNNIVEQGEECEPPYPFEGYKNNENCPQSIEVCDYETNKVAFRDTYGRCNWKCACVEDNLNYKCVKGKCGASCGKDSDCDDNDPHTADACNLETCSCEYEQLPYCGDGNLDDGEECEYDSDCSDTECDQLDGCMGNDYYDYDDRVNDCLFDCSCEQRMCFDYTIYLDDPRCTECDTDEDCDDLDDDYCNGTELIHIEGICEDYVCEEDIQLVEDCVDRNGIINECGLMDWSCSEESSNVVSIPIDYLTLEAEYSNSGNNEVDITVTFKATGNAEDVSIEIFALAYGNMIYGVSSSSTNTFDISEGVTYVKKLTLQLFDDVAEDNYIFKVLIVDKYGTPIIKHFRRVSNQTELEQSEAFCKLTSIEPQNYLCDDDTYCNGQEWCDVSEGCQAGIDIGCSDNQFCTVNEHCDETTDSCVHDNRDCSQNNIPGISNCNNNPDNNPFTFDYRAAFTSVCDDDEDVCTAGAIGITHTCDISECGAECIINEDCDDEDEWTNDYCNDCVCDNVYIPHCGDNNLDEGEECDGTDLDGKTCSDFTYFIDSAEVHYLNGTLSCSSYCEFILECNKYDCADGIDNDNDGLIDYPADPGCGAYHDTSEYNPWKIPFPEQPSTELTVKRITIINEDMLRVGDDILVIITLYNDGDVNLKDLKITVMIPEFGMWKQTGRFDLSKNKEITKAILLEDIPNVEPWEYDIRITASNDILSRVIHRDFKIIN